MEGESVTLEWTYNTGGSAFQEIDLRSQGFPFIVRKTAGASTIILPAFDGRLTANITETNASITSLQSTGATVEPMILLSSIKTSGSLCNRLLWMYSVSQHFLSILLVFVTVIYHF